MHAPGVWVAAATRPAVVLGRAQRALHPDGSLPVRRRRSGGGAVLEGPWLLRALVRLPRDHPLAAHGPAPLAQWAGRQHLAWLLECGVAGAALYEGPTRDHWACFAGRAPGEVMVDGRKLVGIAQAWTSRGIAVSSGTLLHPAPWQSLAHAFDRARDVPLLAASAVALDACTARRVDAAACAAALRATLSRALAPRQHPRAPDA